MAVQLQRRLLTVDDYRLLIRAGSLGEDDRVELIEGEIAEMSPISPTHAGHVTRLTALLMRRLGERALVSVQNPVAMDELSEPQPDVAVLRLREDTYTDAHPGPQDVLLIVEVAETSVEYDRNVKVPLYARAGIPEAWLVSLPDRWIEVYREPSALGYKSIRRAMPGETMSPLAFPDVSLDVGEILK